MKVLVTATNYSKYCQAGKKILENAAVKSLKIRTEDHIHLMNLKKSWRILMEL